MSPKVDLKVVLLGKEGVGKTSLVERYIMGRFNDNKTYNATIGAAYAAKNLKLDDNRTVVLAIWDTAGSERFEAMSRLYYRNARAAIVCFDITDRHSFSRALYWVKEVKEHEQMCRVYLCATKLDLEAERQVLVRDTELYAESIGATLAETSAKSAFGVEQLFRRIAVDFVEFEMNLSESERTDSLGFSTSNRKNFCCF